jgi:DNA-binding MarR family transcriptional regulator
MQDHPAFPKSSLKGDLLYKMVSRHPSIDLGTIQVLSHIQAIAKSVSAKINIDLAEYGLTEGKFYVLTYIFSEELVGHDYPSPSQIADNLGVTRGTITGLLDGLERDGYVQRVDSPTDRRALTIQITQKSHNFLDQFLPAAVRYFDEVLPMDSNEKQKLVVDLSRIELALGIDHSTFKCG